jgi:hypothetical protein
MSRSVKHGPSVCMAFAVALFALNFYSMVTPAMAQGNISSNQCTAAGNHPGCQWNGGCDPDNDQNCGDCKTTPASCGCGCKG